MQYSTLKPLLSGNGLVLLTSFLCVALASPARADEIKTPWEFSNLRDDHCEIVVSYSETSIRVSTPRGGSHPIRITLAGQLPDISERGYSGSAQFDDGSSYVASAADASTGIFGVKQYRWEFTDRSIIFDLIRKNSISLNLDGVIYGPYSLSGSRNPAIEFVDCAGLRPEEVTASNAQYRLTSDHLQLIEEKLWQDSRGWILNRYIAGSIFQWEIREVSDVENFVARVYYKFNRNQTGFVDVNFVDGAVNCFRYHDRPFECKRIY